VGQRDTLWGVPHRSTLDPPSRRRLEGEAGQFWALAYFYTNMLRTLIREATLRKNRYL
jgi:hypothetical protein